MTKEKDMTGQGQEQGGQAAETPGAAPRDAAGEQRPAAAKPLRLAAGFAVRRVPPPQGFDAGPWRIAPAPPPNVGNPDQGPAVRSNVGNRAAERVAGPNVGNQADGGDPTRRAVAPNVGNPPVAAAPSNVGKADAGRPAGGRPSFAQRRPTMVPPPGSRSAPRPIEGAPPPPPAAPPSSAAVDDDGIVLMPEVGPGPMGTTRDLDGAVATDQPVGPDPDQVRLLQEAHQREVRGDEEDEDETASAATRADYLARAKQLCRRYMREIALYIPEDDVNPVDFVNWMMSLKGLIKTNSWRLYRTAVKAWIETLPHEKREEALAMLEADVGIGAEEARSIQRGRRPGHAAEKARAISKEDFDKLVTDLPFMGKSRALVWLEDWCVAGLHVGLRPAEWQATHVEVRPDPTRPRGRRAWLHVINAKATYGRANGTLRTLDISDFSERTFEAVRRMSERGNGWTMTSMFKQRQAECAQELYQVGAYLFPKRLSHRYALYTLRHQFIANMKTIYSPEEVAALSGHGTDETAGEDYGKRRTGWFSEHITDVPVPMPESVQTVRRQLELHERRRQIKMNKRQVDEMRARRQAAAVDPGLEDPPASTPAAGAGDT